MSSENLLLQDAPGSMAAPVDTSGDAEFARQLQAAEASNTRNGPARAAPRGRRRGNARANMMQATMQDQAQAATGVQNPKYTAIVWSVLNFPQALAVIIVLSMASDPFECDRPVAAWLIVSAVRLVLSAACVLAMARYWPDLSTAPVWARTLANIYQPLSTFGLVWFIFGNLWYIGSDPGTCDGDMLRLTLSMVIINYIVLFTPCLVLLIALPFACCCFPLFLRIMHTLNPPPRDPTAGVTQAEIVQATRSVKWAPGMFPDNSCAITMEEYSPGDAVRVLPCGHHFSDAGISTWLQSKNTCPMCRAPIVGGEGAAAVPTRVEVAPAPQGATAPLAPAQSVPGQAVPAGSAGGGAGYAPMLEGELVAP